MVVLYMRLLKFKDKAKKVKDYIPTSSQGHVAFLISNDVKHIGKGTCPGKKADNILGDVHFDSIIEDELNNILLNFLALTKYLFLSNIQVQVFFQKKKKKVWEQDGNVHRRMIRTSLCITFRFLFIH